MQSLIAKLKCPLRLALRLALGIVFLQSGLEKLGHMDVFLQAAQGYRVLPPVLTHAYGVALPWLEILGGGYLVAGLFIRFAAGLTGALLVSFMVAIAGVLMRGDSTTCGCFIGGDAATPVTAALFWRDAAMLAVSAYLIYDPPRRMSLDAWLSDADTGEPPENCATEPNS